MEHKQNGIWRTVVVLVLFGVAFGYVEAAVVVYLRELYEPLAFELCPERMPGDLSPLITLEQLEAADSSHLSLLKTEVSREAATMVMLVSIGLAVGWNFNTCFAGFVIAFGIWDICYYLFLKVLIDWPTSLLDWDLLFLIPLPWVSPVLAPVLVAVSMVVAGTLVLWREWDDSPVRISWQHWLTMILGALVIIVAFCWDYRRVMAGGMPNSFPWSIFFVGEAIGLASFCLALSRNGQRRHRSTCDFQPEVCRVTDDNIPITNIFARIPGDLPEELVETLLDAKGIRIERIVSHNHASSADFWYDQDQHEWIVLMTGSATVQFEDQDQPVELNPGDFIHIPAHRRHRVEWTTPEEPTVWLAVHFV